MRKIGLDGFTWGGSFDMKGTCVQQVWTHSDSYCTIKVAEQSDMRRSNSARKLTCAGLVGVSVCIRECTLHSFRCICSFDRP